MYRYKVKFDNYYKEYDYVSKLDLDTGARYFLSRNNYTYETPAKILGKIIYDFSNSFLSEITKVVLVEGAPRSKNPIKKTYFDREAGTSVVIWHDGDKTVIKVQPGDSFDDEKCIAMHYVKKFFDNRAYYNDMIRESIDGAIETKTKTKKKKRRK